MQFTRTLFIALFLFSAGMLIASESRSTNLLVTFRPEVALSTVGLNSVLLKVRLSDGASAQVWVAETCSQAPEKAYRIEASGEYQVPVSELGNAALACFASSDGLRAQAQFVAKPNE